VLCLAITPEGEILTGSGDQTIRRWADGRCVQVYRGHADSVRWVARPHRAWLLVLLGCLCVRVLGWGAGGRRGVMIVMPARSRPAVPACATAPAWAPQGGEEPAPDQLAACCSSFRGLALLPGVGFVSASHDMTLRVWAMDGSTIAELAGHTALVYSVAAAPGGSLLASGTGHPTLDPLPAICGRTHGCALTSAVLRAQGAPRACRPAAARLLAGWRAERAS
jgi:phospholipase A-2-activating protein